MELRFLDASLDELARRLEQRNAAGGPGTVTISRAQLEQWATRFQPPTPDELALYDAPKG